MKFSELGKSKYFKDDRSTYDNYGIVVFKANQLNEHESIVFDGVAVDAISYYCNDKHIAISFKSMLKGTKRMDELLLLHENIALNLGVPTTAGVYKIGETI